MSWLYRTLDRDFWTSYRPFFFVLSEQALSSLINFAMVLVLLRLFTPDVLGHFTYIFTLVMFVSSLQYGLVLLPTLVHVSPLGRREAAKALDIIGNFEQLYRAVGTLAIIAGSWFVSSDPWSLLCAGAFGTVFLWRETARFVLFATDRAALAFRQALLAFVLFVPALIALLQAGASVTAPLLAFAVSHAVALAIFAPRIVRDRVGPKRAVKRYFSRFGGVRWSVVGSAANEVQMRSHVFAVEALRGVDQVGILEAGRVLWSPLLIAATALQKLLQPGVARAHSAGDIIAAKRMVALACLSILALSAVYMGVIYYAFDHLAQYLFRGLYADVGLFVAAWGAYSVLLIVNWTLIGFLNALHAFRAVAMLSIAAAAGALAMLSCLFWPVPLITVLWVLIAVQAGALVALLWLAMRARASGRQPSGALIGA